MCIRDRYYVTPNDPTVVSEARRTWSRKPDLSTCLLYTSPSPRASQDLVCRLLLEKTKEQTSELQSLMRNSYAVFYLKKKNNYNTNINTRSQREKNRIQMTHKQTI